MTVEWSAVWDFVTMIAVLAGVYVLGLAKVGTTALVKTTAEEAAKATAAQMNWPEHLARELQKTRGVERQELRYRSYGVLWAKLRPLALYDATVMDNASARALSKTLSDWYFSEAGGLMLTRQARDFYFALQDLLRAIGGVAGHWWLDWAEAAGTDPPTVLRAVLARDGGARSGAIAVLDYFALTKFDDWQDAAPNYAQAWRTGLNRIAAAWGDLDPHERHASLQQAGSILRSSLSIDLESRLR